MRNWRNWLKAGLLIIVLVFIASAFLGFSITNQTAEDTVSAIDLESNTSFEVTPVPTVEIAFEVSGQVHNPGVFTSGVDLLVNDAIKMAGGYTELADLDFVYRNILLAVPVSPGQKIYIPKIGANPNPEETLPGVTQDGKININNASSAVLDALPGIGPATIEKIISGRPYRTCSEIDSIKGITSTVKSTLKEKCII